MCTFRYRTILQNKTIILCISCFDAIQQVLNNPSKSGRLTANIFSLTTDRNSVADLLCLSRIRVFSIPDPNYFYPGSGIRIKEFKYFNPKIVSKLSELGSGSFILDPDPKYFIHSGSCIPDPGVKKAPDPRPRIRIRNTG